MEVWKQKAKSDMVINFLPKCTLGGSPTSHITVTHNCNHMVSTRPGIFILIVVATLYECCWIDKSNRLKKEVDWMTFKRLFEPEKEFVDLIQ